MKYVGTFLGGIFALWLVAVMVEKVSIYASTPSFSEETPTAPSEEKKVLIKRKGGKPAAPASPSEGSEYVKPAPAKPVVKESASPVVTQARKDLLDLALREKFCRGLWNVKIQNQIRMVKDNLRLGKSENYAIAKIAELEDWIGFRQWQGDYPYTVQMLQTKKARWENYGIEVERRLDNCLKTLEQMKEVNDVGLENIEEYIKFLR